MFASMFFGVAFLAWLIFLVWGTAKAFDKAGQPMWAALIPIYNYFVMVKIAKQSQWLFWLAFVPFIGIIASAIVMFNFSKQFNKGDFYSFAMIFFAAILMPLMGFDDSRYSSTTPTPDRPMNAVA